MTSNGTASYVYDAENRLIATAGYSYIYDGDGQRVEKCTEGTTPGTCASGATGTLYWRGLGSDALRETDLAGNLRNNYVFFGGQRVARSDSAGAVHYYFSDHLGTHGVVENATGTACEQDIDYYPYGGVQNDYCPNVAQNYKFTGKERDTESGLDYFGARYNASSMGRFMTPDPLLNSGRPGSPQTWNRYAYALNNPLKIVDPTGLYNVDCGSDKTCIKAAKNLKNGLSDLQKKVDKMKDGTQKTRLENALKAMGTENDKNNVNVSFGATKGGGAGETVPVSDPQTYKESFNVTLDPGKLNGSNDYAIAGAHEGTHVDDISSELANPSLGVLSDFSLEYRGYQTSAYAASALGQDSLSMNYDGKSSVIWNGSWGAVDKNITNFVTSFHDKNGKQDHPETTPHNPWPN
jgi:RHS repeat-associated protein